MRFLNPCSLAIFDLGNRCVRQPVQPHTLYARLFVFDKTLAYCIILYCLLQKNGWEAIKNKRSL